jgi:hypothetical protein
VDRSAHGSPAPLTTQDEPRCRARRLKTSSSPDGMPHLGSNETHQGSRSVNQPKRSSSRSRRLPAIGRRVLREFTRRRIATGLSRPRPTTR